MLRKQKVHFKKIVHTRDSLFKFYFIVLCVGALCVCLAVHLMNVVPWRPEDNGSLKPELWTDESHHIGCWELKLSLPIKQVHTPYLNHCLTSPCPQKKLLIDNPQRISAR